MDTTLSTTPLFLVDLGFRNERACCTQHNCARFLLLRRGLLGGEDLQEVEIRGSHFFVK